jgi:hypothetical protein
MLKSMKGLLDVRDPRQWWTETIEALAARPLFAGRSTSALFRICRSFTGTLIDRALIAQAVVEDLTLVTTDKVSPDMPLNGFGCLDSIALPNSESTPKTSAHRPLQSTNGDTPEIESRITNRTQLSTVARF